MRDSLVIRRGREEQGGRREERLIPAQTNSDQERKGRGGGKGCCSDGRKSFSPPRSPPLHFACDGFNRIDGGGGGGEVFDEPRIDEGAGLPLAGFPSVNLTLLGAPLGDINRKERRSGTGSKSLFLGAAPSADRVQQFPQGRGDIPRGGAEGSVEGRNEAFSVFPRAARKELRRGGRVISGWLTDGGERGPNGEGEEGAFFCGSLRRNKERTKSQ